MKKRLVSGITATGQLTIGNYIGAIKNFVKLQDEYELFIFVADLHALTIEISPEELRKNKRDIMAIYLACGLNPEKATLFYQSDVKAHGQMNWIMENQTTIGELSRMTQFKDKSKTKMANKTEKINTGLLTYPTLMAGDILLYQPNIVPVGKDQKQHIELTKSIATRFNNKYGETFVIPEFYTPKTGSKIMALNDPSKKMSKSSKVEKSYISLLEDPDKAYKKIMKAVTDSEGKIYASPEKEGITNLLTIYASLKDITIKKAEELTKDMNYGIFKSKVGEEVKDFLIDLQSKFNNSIKEIDNIAENGAKKARKIANKTLEKVERKLGL
ncbi:MAG: tryptophan--tRNA ligase [Mycoplasmatales bacterium]|nr:tryptophan--tRNA ligase [Mycoplasmatales bacterium]